MKKQKNSILIEKLAALEHVQWTAWSKEIARKHELTKKMMAEWRSKWVTYRSLNEKDKKEYRTWAVKTLYVLKVFFRAHFTVNISEKKFLLAAKKFKKIGMDDADLKELYRMLSNEKGIFIARERK